MQYFISFLEGIITFLSPCLLPMLPVYVSFFAGGGTQSRKKTVTAALGFVTGFTVVFVAMGALAGTLGSFLIRHQRMVHVVSGLVLIVFGLNYLGVLKMQIFKGNRRNYTPKEPGFWGTALFGMIFSVGWTPCVGTFLGAALIMASSQGQALAGMLMLLFYSLGLGIPFLLSALLIDSLKKTFDFVKRNYGVVNGICGLLLMAIGILMATGTLGKLLTILS